MAANVELLARRATGELMAVVKADGFGHGAAAVARTALAHGATRLGVTSVDEALALRAAKASRRPVLSWLNPVDADFATAVDAAASRWPSPAASTSRRSPAPRRAPRVHLHLDTGLARDGAAPSEWAGLCRAARRAERQGLVRVVGVMGHLACADVPGDPANALGRARFAWGVETARAAGLRPAAPAPGRDRGHPHRPAQPPHDVPGRRRPGRDRPVRHDRRCGPR